MDQRLVEWIREKYQPLAEVLTEHARRRWAAVEATSLGWGGLSAVAEATGLAHTTIRRGIQEIEPGTTIPEGRQRHRGAGRKRADQLDPDLKACLDQLVESDSRGDPQSPLRWTCKSTRTLTKELKARKHSVGATTVRHLLKEAGYSLQANRKTREGKSHLDRDAQFRYINRRVKSQQRQGEPTISVDTKKKETVGNLKNPGRTWRRKRKPVEVNMHDFPDPKKGKAVPYGVYDLARNEAWVSVGISSDTGVRSQNAVMRQYA
jgi:Rhodopirellula transposase DDE domain